MKKIFSKLSSSKEIDRNNHDDGKRNKECVEDRSYYQCKYCEYNTAQKWILDRHISSVHYKISCCQKLYSRCYLNDDGLKDPYSSKACSWCWNFARQYFTRLKFNNDHFHSIFWRCFRSITLDAKNLCTLNSFYRVLNTNV